MKIIDNSERDEDDEELFIVEKILGHRHGSDNKLEYLIKWKGYSEKHNSWEPEVNFLDKEVINKYWNEINGTKQTKTKKIETNLLTILSII